MSVFSILQLDQVDIYWMELSRLREKTHLIIYQLEGSDIPY